MKNVYAYVLALFLMVSFTSVNAFALTSANNGTAIALIKKGDDEKKGGDKKKKSCCKKGAAKCAEGKKEGCCKGKKKAEESGEVAQ